MFFLPGSGGYTSFTVIQEYLEEKKKKKEKPKVSRHAVKSADMTRACYRYAVIVITILRGYRRGGVLTVFLRSDHRRYPAGTVTVPEDNVVVGPGRVGLPITGGFRVTI